MTDSDDKKLAAARDIAEKLEQFIKEGALQLPGLIWKVAEPGTHLGTLTSTHPFPGGTLELRFTPGPELGEEAKRFGTHLARAALDNSVVEGAPTPRESLEAYGDSEREEVWGKHITVWYLVFYAHVLHNNLALALRATPEEARFVTDLKVSQIQARAAIETMDNIVKMKAPRLREFLLGLVNKAAEEKRELLEKYVEVTSPLARVELMPEHYERLYAVWKDAKRLSDEHGEAWAGMLKAKYADLTFDDDLLARLSGNTSGLRESLLERIEEQGGEPIPSSIALEHAARMCGAYKYQYHARTLYRYATAPRKTDEGDLITDTAA